MYKLKSPTIKQLSDYYNDYGPRVQSLMQQLANGKLTVPITLGRGTTAVKLILQVQSNSHVWQFLNKYAQEDNLRKLLCGGWHEHMTIVREVSQLFPNEAWQKGMLKGEYDNHEYTIYGQDTDGNEIVESFNDIMHWLFVVQMYEGKDNIAPFSKKDFVADRDMMVCPYCGREWIDMAELGTSVSKPDIDHFLPKSKYPFLAMSYCNMIPACHICNEIQNKGDMDPLVYPNLEKKLLNPYDFYDNAVRFGYLYNGQGENNEKNFTITSKAENDYLKEGYLEKLKLEVFYSHQKKEVKDLYRRFTKATGSMKKFLMRLGLKSFFLDDIEQSTLGYQLNEDEASERLMYKFKKDVYEDLKKKHGL